MKCEQGDIAKIINAINESNIGKTVFVESYIGYFNQFENFDFKGLICTAYIADHYWWIESDRGLTNSYGETIKAYAADSWLEPIRPDATKIKNKDRIDLTDCV